MPPSHPPLCWRLWVSSPCRVQCRFCLRGFPACQHSSLSCYPSRRTTPDVLLQRLDHTLSLRGRYQLHGLLAHTRVHPSHGLPELQAEPTTATPLPIIRTSSFCRRRMPHCVSHPRLSSLAVGVYRKFHLPVGRLCTEPHWYPLCA